MGYAVTYTGVEGLTLVYSMSDIVGTTAALSGEQTAWKASYAYGPVTATMTQSEYDVTTTTSDQDVSSVAVSYTISDEMSVTYGTETIESTSSGHVDAEYDVIKVNSSTSYHTEVQTKLRNKVTQADEQKVRT
jgi:hypothetical protein